MVDMEEVRQYADYHNISVDDVTICNDCLCYKSMSPLYSNIGLCTLDEDDKRIVWVSSDCFCKWGKKKGGVKHGRIESIWCML